MKCTNCGKNTANYHYEYNINGKRTEMHLCPDCAAKLQPERAFANETRGIFREFDRMLDGFMDDSFFGDSFFGGGDLFGRGFLTPMVGFFPAIFAPRVQVAAPVQERPADNEADPELSRQRELNALREQMKAAAEAEDYEKAAALRDKLRKLEK